METMDAALSGCHPPIYCLREIVHNRQVVESFKRRGVVFVQSLDDIPAGATVVFSAHGIPPSVGMTAKKRRLRVVDATCPFVTRVHSAVRLHARRGFTVIMIGHRNHDEVIGVVGEAPDHVVVVENEAEARAITVSDAGRVAVVTQTTLSHLETERVRSVLRERFPAIEGQPGDDVCYATLNRQESALKLASLCDRVLVLGSRNSSNTNRLAEVAGSTGKPADIVSEVRELDSIPLGEVSDLGITAGASTPDEFVAEIVKRLKDAGFDEVEEMPAVAEDFRFQLPQMG